MKTEDINTLIEKSKTLSELARYIFGKENYTNREKVKKILTEHNIEWEKWLENKKTKPKKYCLYCGKEITNGDNRKKFCNQSCSAKYNNIGKVKNHKGGNPKERFCLNCCKPLINRQKKYCSVFCQTEYEYKNFIKKWKNGAETAISGTDGISSHIRKYLFEKYDNKCQLCGWGEKNVHTGNVPLQIHHIDGDCTNNKEENLQLLCPNCHSLTDNYGSSNKASKRVDRRAKYYRIEKEESNKETKEIPRCIVCGKKLEGNQTTYCSISCCKKHKIKDISKNDILKIFYENKKLSYKKAAKILGISTTCLNNKCRIFGIINEIQKIRFNL